MKHLGPEDKTRYTQTLERRMWSLATELEKLAARAAALTMAGPVTRALHDELSSTLQAQHEWLRRRLGELHALGAEGWHELQGTIEAGWREIDKTLHRSARFA